jgi:hypothetical protein
MAMQTQTQEPSTLNVKLVHFTKQNSPDEPVQVVSCRIVFLKSQMVGELGLQRPLQDGFGELFSVGRSRR